MVLNEDEKEIELCEAVQRMQELCSQPITPGSVLPMPTGDFRFVRYLGEGTFGWCMQAYSERANKTCAVKIISLRRLAETSKCDIEEAYRDVAKETRQRLEHVELCELCMQIFFCTKLRDEPHENIIRFFTHVRVSNTIFMLFEFIDDGELFDHIVVDHGMERWKAKVFFKQLLCAVNFLHERHIAHRDIKPENLLITKNLQLRLTDFGFAIRCVDKHGNQQWSQKKCGTRPYLAPEVIVAAPERPYEPRKADIWSCGVVFFTMLFGQMPFNEASKDCKLYTRFERHITQKKTKPDYSPYNKLEKDVSDALLCCMYPVANKRASAIMALKQPFFKQVPKRPPMHGTAMSQAPPYQSLGRVGELTLQPPTEYRPRTDLQDKEDAEDGVQNKQPRYESVSMSQPVTVAASVLPGDFKRRLSTQLPAEEETKTQECRRMFDEFVATRMTRFETQTRLSFVHQTILDLVEKTSQIYLMRDREMKAKVAGIEILMHLKDNETDVSITVNIYDMGTYRLLDFRRLRGDVFAYQRAYQRVSTEIKRMLAEEYDERTDKKRECNELLTTSVQ